MKHNKSADSLLFLLSLTKSQREKNIEITLFVSAGTQRGEKQRVVETFYRNIYQIQKINFQ